MEKNIKKLLLIVGTILAVAVIVPLFSAYQSNHFVLGDTLTINPRNYIFSDSLSKSGSTVTLVNDSASPSASQYYGTNGSSTLGYFSLPSVPVSSVSNIDGTLTVSPTTGAVVVSLAVGHGNTWTGQQTFNTSAPIFGTMTQGSVLYAGASGLLSQDNSNFFWDATNHRLGIGTTSPQQTLFIKTTQANTNQSFAVGGPQELSDGIAIQSVNDAYTQNKSLELRGSTIQASIINSGGYLYTKYEGGGTGDTQVARYDMTTSGNPYLTVGNNTGGGNPGGYILYDRANSRIRFGMHGATGYTMQLATTGSIVGVDSGVAPSILSAFGVLINSASTLGMVTKEASGQTADPFEIQNNNAGVLSSFNSSGNLNLGLLGTTTGDLNIIGTTSGTVGISVADSAGNWTMKLPTSGGTANQYLQTNGSGVTTWATGGSGAEQTITYQPGLLTAVNATKGVYGKFVNASTVDNIEGSAVTFSCVANPTITLYECGTSSTCASSTTIGTVTVTGSGQAFDGTISNSAITAGDYIAWAMTAGTCASIDISATAQVHAN